MFSAVVITGVNAIANSHTAPVGTDITTIYDQNIDTGGSVKDTTFVVHAMQTGQIVNPPHDNTIGVVGDTITFNPDNDFKPGETIHVIATDGIRNTLAEASVKRVWEFRAEASGGTGLFGNSGQGLGNHSSRDAALSDLDSDGDLDAFVANAGGSPNRVWMNDGSSNFTDGGQDLGDHFSCDVALGDLDGDGDLDAFVTNRNFFPGGQANHVWLNQELRRSPKSSSAAAAGRSPSLIFLRATTRAPTAIQSLSAARFNSARCRGRTSIRS